jgi:NAD kinase
MVLDKIVVVTKKTMLEELLLEHATISQTRFYLESRGKNFDKYLNSHQEYISTISDTIKNLPNEYKKQIIDKSLLSTYQFDEHDIIIVVGDPGLFVNTAKYSKLQPIISITGEPKQYDNIFTTCVPTQIRKKIQNLVKGDIKIEELTMAQAVLDDGQTLLALNDLFIGKKTHVSARYTLSQDKITEAQSSSGIVVSTGTGSTAWMNSLFVGAYGILGRANSIEKANLEIFERNSNYLRYFVREPFPTKTTSCEMITGYVNFEHPLNIISNMVEDGVIFSDGIEKDYISFNAGASVKIMPAKNKVQLVR